MLKRIIWIKSTLKKFMPEVYFKLMNKSDFKEHEIYINKILDPENHQKIFNQKSDKEEFLVCNYDLRKLKNKILKVVSDTRNDILLYRIFPNKDKNFILASFYENLDVERDRAEFNIPENNNFKKLFLGRNWRLKKHVDVDYSLDEKKKKTVIKIKCVNVAHNTMISNVIETLQRHKLISDFVEIWQIKKSDKKIKSYYEITIEIESVIPEFELNSLRDDFARYIQLYIKSMSIFDMVGPAMVWPSSSHTAWANRIWQIARNIILAMVESGEKINDIEIKLIWSFRDTWVGHKTPLALGWGLCGFDTDDPKMLIAGEPENLKKKWIKFGNQTAKFNWYKKWKAEDDLRYANQRQSNIAEVIVNTADSKHVITWFSIWAWNVEIRVIDKRLEFPITWKIDLVLNKWKVEKLNSKNENCPKIKKIYEENFVTDFPMMPFHTFEELIEYTKKEKIWIIDLILDIENKLQNTDKKYVYEKMRNYWRIMQKSVDDGIKSNKLSMMKLSWKDSSTINKYRLTNKTFDNIYWKAVTYAVAVNEVNAKSGTIVACPTAWSCGILPWVLKAYNEISKPKEDKILESLMIAGFFGMILFDDVSTAWADYGCQAEVWAAAWMAAAALVYLEWWDVEQMVEWFIIAIKNCLWLVCDPVAWLVEVPCIKRNWLYSSHAISAALMALSGVKSFVSPDEVVLTMREIWARLNIDYKETWKWGLAKTRDWKWVEKRFEEEVNKFFE